MKFPPNHRAGRSVDGLDAGRANAPAHPGGDAGAAIRRL